ncbi:hypothetical protein [Ferrovibrio sp.]|jgi:hypothetical protein|uniref:hypothetical protein n=1 Tax=Ferrovibrio sp. TaxID=1917215 RepID=UPI0035B3D47C
MQAEAIKIQGLIKLAHEISNRKSQCCALLVDFSGIPGIRNRVLFRAFVSFVEERCLDHALHAHPLARNVIVVILPHAEETTVLNRLSELNHFLLQQRHGTIGLHRFHLDTEVSEFIAFASRLMEQAPAPPVHRSIQTVDPAPPDIVALDHLIGIERSIGQADLTLQMRSQTIWDLQKDQPPGDFAEELWVSMSAVEKITGQDLHDDAWMLGRSTDLADKRLLAFLVKEIPLADARRVRRFIGLTPANVAGSDFHRLIGELSAAQLSDLVIELTLLDWRMDPQAGREVAAMLRRNGIGLALSCLRAEDLPHLTREDIEAAQFLKLDASAQPIEQLATGLKTLNGPLLSKTILGHCDTEEQIAVGILCGIRLFQGSRLTHFLDNPDLVEKLLGRSAALHTAAAIRTAHKD